MITKKKWELLKEKQAELDQLIVEKSPTELKWVSCFNVERLKLALLVDEFANEIKSFKAWRKKPEIDENKVKEELIDCLGYFLGLVGIYQIDMPPALPVADERKNLPFNKLLLDFFSKTNNLHIEEKENSKIGDQAKNTYYDWWKIFETLCWKLKISESELLDIYLEKNRVNLKRVHAR